MAIDYFEDPSQWGQYQYVTLEQVINDFLMSMDEDNYLVNIPRHKLLYHGLRGVRELTFDVLQEIRAIELDLGPSLTVTVPPDFVNYVRISQVDENGMLHPMAMDRNMSTASAYLQDNDYEILFDSNGCPLIGTGRRDTSHLDNGNDNQGQVASEGISQFYFYGGSCSTYNPNTNFSNVFLEGKYRLDRQNGVIEFGSDVFGRSIVLEYISDGLYVSNCEGTTEANIKVHKFAEDALFNYMFYACVRNNRNVPQSEKMRARKEWYNSRRIAKRRIATLRKSEMIQDTKGSSVNIKDPNLNI